MIRVHAWAALALLVALPAGAAADREGLPGAATYRHICAECHDKAVYKAPARFFLQQMTPDAIYAALNGVMQSQAAAMTDLQKREVAEYLGDPALRDEGHSMPPACAHPAPDRNAASRLYGWGGDLGNSHFIPGDVAGLPATKIPRLKLRWAFGYPGATRARSQPTVDMGTVFVGSQSGAVYALDARKGCLRWSFRARAEVRTPVVLSRDDVQAQHKATPRAFFGDLTGHVYALDARTGKLLWTVAVEEHPSVTLTGAPAYYQGRLYVPVSSLEEATAGGQYECCTFRGSVVALDAVTGATVWKAYTIDEEPRAVASTADGSRVFAPSGAAVWNAPTIDVARGLLYVGTGDNYSEPANDRSDAVLAFELATGHLRWAHQMLAQDAWNVGCILGRSACPARPGPDSDIGAGTVLVPGAHGRSLLVAGLKSGAVVALDPDHPDAIAWTRRLGRGGIEGGVQFALARDERHIYVPISDMTDNHDGKTAAEPPHPGLYALDPATGRLAWAAPANDVCHQRPDCDPGILAAVTVVPGAVFAGHMDGRVRAYESATGRVLWEYDSTQEVLTVSGARAHGGSVGGGGPVVAGGMVYVNSGYGIYWHMPGNLLLAFSVDGH